jgi:hypothetical protein
MRTWLLLVVVLGCGDNLAAPGRDAATGPTGPTDAAADAPIDSPAPAVCGDGVIESGETCDGSNLGSATCESLGDPSGTLVCKADCSGFDTTGCTGNFNPQGSGFTTAPTICNDGLRTNSPSGFSSTTTTFDALGVCTEDQGIWFASTFDSTGSDAEITTISWTNQDGTAAPVNGVAMDIQSGGGTTGIYFTANTTGSNGFRAGTFGDGAPNWQASVFVPRIFSMLTGGSNLNLMGGWDPVSGLAIVKVGNVLGNDCVPPATKGCSIPVFVNGGSGAGSGTSAGSGAVTGTVTSIITGLDKTDQRFDTSIPTDIHVAIYGQQGGSGADPNGGSASGGIYWTCDNGMTYVEHDTGIAASDLPLVFKLVADQSTFSINNTRACPTTTDQLGTGYATVMYAGLRGGGSLYKTTDGGDHWALSNTGLPANAQVFSLVEDCADFVPPVPPAITTADPTFCPNPNVLYVGTNVGVYESVDSGASWHEFGFIGKSVRSIAINPDHAVGLRPRMFVGVDNDPIVLYDRNVGDSVP